MAKHADEFVKTFAQLSVKKITVSRVARAKTSANSLRRLYGINSSPKTRLRFSISKANAGSYITFEQGLTDRSKACGAPTWFKTAT